DAFGVVEGAAAEGEWKVEQEGEVEKEIEQEIEIEKCESVEFQ
ncbi:MAG: hypothetical protein EZS28_045583, partial [Streblomastix strix]